MWLDGQRSPIVRSLGLGSLSTDTDHDDSEKAEWGWQKREIQVHGKKFIPTNVSPKGGVGATGHRVIFNEDLIREDGQLNMASTEHTYTQGEFKVTEQMKSDFDRDGFIIIRNLLDEEERENLSMAIENKDGGLRDRAFQQDDGGGLKVTMIHWKHPGSDVSGIIARSKKVAGTFEKLLGGEVYHYSGKINMKEAHSGGQHLWHQDYG
ncbi:Hypp4813 [Branchiostoma lanceolatum]|uniref:Hypp4813 protein n=1 Tax=Branchiostoma lanceolatum TaxID=7740 RepID=A0A8K0AAC8_BRALA|nr:Hypp4813 [Branchiostoma lanceolatum]